MSQRADEIVDQWLERRAEALKAAGLTMGPYRHYKGDLYVVTHIALDSTNGHPRVPMVGYFGFEKLIDNIRPLSEFTEVIQWPDGVMRPRFSKETEWPRAAVATTNPAGDAVRNGLEVNPDFQRSLRTPKQSA